MGSSRFHLSCKCYLSTALWRFALLWVLSRNWDWAHMSAHLLCMRCSAPPLPFGKLNSLSTSKGDAGTDKDMQKCNRVQQKGVCCWLCSCDTKLHQSGFRVSGEHQRGREHPVIWHPRSPCNAQQVQ
jgi:hypothetical protein